MGVSRPFEGGGVRPRAALSMRLRGEMTARAFGHLLDAPFRVSAAEEASQPDVRRRQIVIDGYAKERLTVPRLHFDAHPVVTNDQKPQIANCLPCLQAWWLVAVDDFVKEQRDAENLAAQANVRADL